MTDLHTAAKLALEALKNYVDVVMSVNDPNDWRTVADGGKPAREAITALQQALEQPAQQEPVAYMGTDIEGNPNKFRLNPFGGCVPLYKKPPSVKVWDAEGYDALCQQLEGWKTRALKAEQPAQQECFYCGGKSGDHGSKCPAQQEPVFDCPRCGHCCPQAREPLTDEEINDVAASCMWWVREQDILDDAIELARAIERAHGITGEKK